MHNLFRCIKFPSETALRLFSVWAQLPVETCVPRDQRRSHLALLAQTATVVLRRTCDRRAAHAALRALIQCFSASNAPAVSPAECLDLLLAILSALASAGSSNTHVAERAAPALAWLRGPGWEQDAEDKRDQTTAWVLLLVGAVLTAADTDSVATARVFSLLAETARAAAQRNGAASMWALAQVLRRCGCLPPLPPSLQTELAALSGLILDWTASNAPAVHLAALAALRDFATRTTQADLVPKMVPVAARPAFSALARKALPPFPSEAAQSAHRAELVERAEQCVVVLARWPAVEAAVEEGVFRDSSRGRADNDGAELPAKRFKADGQSGAAPSSVSAALIQLESALSMLEDALPAAAEPGAPSALAGVYRRLGQLLQNI